ncbi:unnamed protein product [Rangifer tarandus platyrhynchus]|uniref:Uncharacterized protein n=1 Tax=Rangifer tarandus platyrhynchus TaxID=3082113 RepID=A0AC59YG96_RANTA
MPARGSHAVPRNKVVCLYRHSRSFTMTGAFRGISRNASHSAELETGVHIPDHRYETVGQSQPETLSIFAVKGVRTPIHNTLECGCRSGAMAAPSLSMPASCQSPFCRGLLPSPLASTAACGRICCEMTEDFRLLPFPAPPPVAASAAR